MPLARRANVGIFILGFSGLLSCETPAQAGPPILFRTCPEVAYKAGAGPLIFDESCKAAYLLPGPVGQMEVTGSFISVTDEQCESVAAAQSAALGAFGDAASRANARKDIQRKRDALAEKVADLTNQRDPLEQAKTGVSQAHDKAAASAGKLEKQFADDCGSDSGKSFSCYSLADDLKKQKDAETETSSQIQKIDGLLKQIYDQLASAQDEDKGLKADYERLEKGQSDPAEQAEAIKTLNDLRSQQGATISATLITPLAAELKEVRNANSAKGIQIEAMRFEGGSIYVGGLAKSETPQLTGAARIELPGQQLTEGGTLFVNASGAKITLDTVAACQMFGYKNPANLSTKDLSNKVAGALVAKAYLKYKALLNVTINVKMDYNKFYELLVSTDSKNGFFKTSTVKSVSETMRADGSLSIEIVDEGNVLTADEKDALQSAMRDRVVQRALDFLNPKYVGVDPGAAPGAPTAGAGQLANALRKCPNQWCQVGAVVVDVANSIFGGSASRQSFVQSLGVATSETYKNSDAIDLVTDFTFVTGK